MTRHRNTIHVPDPYWCMVPGCHRSENYDGDKNPFSRKDKRDEHARRVHQAVGLGLSNANLRAGLPSVNGLNNVTYGLALTSVDRLNADDGYGLGFSNAAFGLTSVDGLNNVPYDFALPSTDGLGFHNASFGLNNTSLGLNNANVRLGLTGVDGLNAEYGPGFCNTEFSLWPTSVDRFNNVAYDLASTSMNGLGFLNTGLGPNNIGLGLNNADLGLGLTSVDGLNAENALGLGNPELGPGPTSVDGLNNVAYDLALTGAEFTGASTSQEQIVRSYH